MAADRRYFVSIEDAEGDFIDLEFESREDAGRVAQIIRQTLTDVPPKNLGEIIAIDEAQS